MKPNPCALPALLLLTLLALSACGAEEPPATGAPPSLSAAPEAAHFLVAFESPIAAQDRDAIERAVSARLPARGWVWHAEGKEAQVTLEARTPQPMSLLGALEESDVRAEVRRLSEARFVFVKALHCPGCVKKVQETAGGISATREVEVDAKRESVRILFVEQKASDEDYRRALEEAGYPVRTS